MKPRSRVGLRFIILISVIALAACSTSQNSNPQDTFVATATPPAQDNPASVTSVSSQNELTSTPGQVDVSWPDGQAQQDAQGAVEVTITPLNLNNPGETLDFEVSLNTHSLDLSMDLSTLATLTTDSGLSVSASRWDAPRGGHHVQGKLSFPSKVDGVAILDKAKRVTLTIKNLDAPERVFTWER